MVRLSDIYRELVDDYRELVEDLRNRIDMPQISTEDLPTGFEMLRDMGIRVRVNNRPAYGLKPSQKQMNTGAINKLAEKLKDVDFSDYKPIVISNDGYIVDGHHRWGAILILHKEKLEFPFMEIDLPRDEAIEQYSLVANKLRN